MVLVFEDSCSSRMCSVEGDKSSELHPLLPAPPPPPQFIRFPSFYFPQLWFLCQALLSNMKPNNYQNKGTLVSREHKLPTLENQRTLIPEVKSHQVHQKVAVFFGIHT